MVGGDERPGVAQCEEVAGNGDGEGGALFGIGGGAELVEEYEGRRVGETWREAIEIEDVSGEGGVAWP